MTRLDNSFGFLVSRLASGLRAALEARLVAYELTAPQWAVLMRLQEKDHWPLKQLGVALGMDKATIGGVVQRLEAKKLIERCKDDDDARYFRVSLTEGGRMLAKETARFGEDVNEGVLSHFGARERGEFLHMLQRSRQLLNE